VDTFYTVRAFEMADPLPASIGTAGYVPSATEIAQAQAAANAAAAAKKKGGKK